MEEPITISAVASTTKEMIEPLIKESIETIIKEGGLENQINIIRNQTLDGLKSLNENAIQNRLIENQKAIKELSPYSDEINKYIRNVDELHVYNKTTHLKEQLINDRPHLINSNIDLNIKDDFGKTNQQRLEIGKSPLNNEGVKIELHHIGQKPYSPFAELPEDIHDKYSSILHVRDESQIDRIAFDKERATYWKERLKIIMGGNMV